MKKQYSDVQLQNWISIYKYLFENSDNDWYKHLQSAYEDKKYYKSLLQNWNSIVNSFDKFVDNCKKYHNVDENGWILPDGRIVGVDAHRQLAPYFDDVKNMQRIKEFSKHYTDDEMLDECYIDDEPILLYDLLSSGFVKFSIAANTCTLGNNTTKDVLYVLYDLVDAVCNNESNIQNDIKKKFIFMLDIGQGIDQNGKIVTTPSFSKSYTSIDEFNNIFINDIKNHCKIH